MKAQVSLLFLFLAACSEAEAPREPAREPSVFDDLTGTLDRAEGVEDTLRDSAAERRRQLEAAEGR